MKNLVLILGLTLLTFGLIQCGIVKSDAEIQKATDNLLELEKGLIEKLTQADDLEKAITDAEAYVTEKTPDIKKNAGMISIITEDQQAILDDFTKKREEMQQEAMKEIQGRYTERPELVERMVALLERYDAAVDKGREEELNRVSGGAVDAAKDQMAPMMKEEAKKFMDQMIPAIKDMPPDQRDQALEGYKTNLTSMGLSDEEAQQMIDEYKQELGW